MTPSDGSVTRSDDVIYALRVLVRPSLVPAHLPCGKRSWLPSRRPAARTPRPWLRATSWRTHPTRCTRPAGGWGTAERKTRICTALFQSRIPPEPLLTLSLTSLTMSRYGRPGFTISMSAPSLTSRSCSAEQQLSPAGASTTRTDTNQLTTARRARPLAPGGS